MRTTDRTVGTGRIGISDPFVEGTPETRRAAREKQARELRLATARHRFLEVPAEHLETRRVGRVTYVVDTRTHGHVYEYLGVEVFAPGGHEVAFNEDAVAAFTVVDGEIVFFKQNGAAIANLEKLEQYQSDLAWHAARKQAITELKLEKHEQAQATYRASQPLRTVLLGDLEGRELPTVRAAAQRIHDLGGTLEAKAARLVLRLPENLATSPSEHDRLHAELTECVRVLVAVERLVLRGDGLTFEAAACRAAPRTRMSPRAEVSREPPAKPPARAANGGSACAAPIHTGRAGCSHLGIVSVLPGQVRAYSQDSCTSQPPHEHQVICDVHRPLPVLTNKTLGFQDQRTYLWAKFSRFLRGDATNPPLCHAKNFQVTCPAFLPMAMQDELLRDDAGHRHNRCLVRVVVGE
jgi:hypothetical protein